MTGEGIQIHETYHNTELLKKLPEHSEATAVMVGAVDFLTQPTLAFVRLAEGVLMDEVVEVSTCFYLFSKLSWIIQYEH